MAASIPELDLIIELIGAFACTLVAIIIPTILHLVAFYERTDGFQRKWLIMKNTLILIFGFLVLCTGTYFSLQGIVERFQDRLQSSFDDDNDLLTPSFNNNITVVRMPFWFDKLINLTQIATTTMNITDQPLNQTLNL